ncbi:MAG TPA: PfkB family carbohydrate kinase [Candidatus Andersenbacteria bacterium]|nr:MAG: hypothetical protein A2854_02120 [Parcubacteria group bacterium RIFCSPHIGHO2_01_FULL_56_18]HLD25629.1 PfkB family carbohydrate kinase [Candidatus Andersenbacteria bacterium]
MSRGVEHKIKTLPYLAAEVRRLQRAGKTVVQCHGVFDLIHPGHLRHFAAARREGDVLVVTLTADRYVKRGPGRPLFSEHLRAESLAALELVDFVAIVASPTAVECLETLRPNVYVKGPDYRQARDDVTGMITAEKQAVERHGGRLHITDDIVFSSTQLINAELDVQPPLIRRYLQRLANDYSVGTITQLLQRLEQLRILVIGDAIIDQYDYVRPLGKSGKEPLVVSKFVERESFAGGVLATATHVASLSRNVRLATLLGRRHSWREFIDEKLSPRINPKFFYRRGAVTTVKRRYVSEGRAQKMFEIYFIDDTLLDRTGETAVIRWLAKMQKNLDLIIVNDFGHGFITEGIIAAIRRSRRKLAINVQTNGANAGFNLVTKYPRADFVCVDEVELRYAAHDRDGDLKHIMKKISRQLKCELLVTTRGRKGSLSWSRSEGFIATPAFATQVVDAVGAGDAFFAYAAPCFAAGFPPTLVPFVGNVAGSLATQIVGNRSAVELPDVLKFIGRLLK